MYRIYVNGMLFFASCFRMSPVSLQTFDPEHPLTLKQVGVVWRVVASHGSSKLVIAERNTKAEAEKILTDIWNSRKKHLTFEEDPTLWKSAQLAEVK